MPDDLEQPAKIRYMVGSIPDDWMPNVEEMQRLREQDIKDSAVAAAQEIANNAVLSAQQIAFAVVRRIVRECDESENIADFIETLRRAGRASEQIN